MSKNSRVSRGLCKGSNLFQKRAMFDDDDDDDDDDVDDDDVERFPLHAEQVIVR